MINSIEIIYNENCVAKNFITLLDPEKLEILAWRNNDKIRKWMFNSRIISESDHFDFVKKLKNDTANGYFVLADRSRNIGVLSLNEINYEQKKANLGVYAKPGLKGAGPCLLTMIFHLAFTILHLDVLRAEVLATNAAAISLYENRGFYKAGVMDKKVDQNGNEIAVLIYLFNSKQNTNCRPTGSKWDC